MSKVNIPKHNMAETEGVSYINVTPLLKPYLDESYATTACEKISIYKEKFERILSPIEGWLMTIQSLLVWKDPKSSLTLFVFLNILFWIITSYNFLAVLCWGTLTIYLLYIWKTEIWPVVRVPAKTKDQDEWTLVYENLLSVPELSQYIAEYFVTALVYIEALKSLRKKRRMAFLVLAYLFIFPVIILSMLIADSLLLYVLGLTLTLTPPCIYHGVFTRVYMTVEPYLMALQYQLKQKLNTGRPRTEREANAQGDVAETDSDDDENVCAIDPARSAAIARTITDSEDESLAAHSDSSNGDFGLGDNIMSASMTASFAPEVSQMPDFEGVCDEPNSLMPDDDVMPSMDSIDTTRLPHEILDPADQATDSDIESLPDDSPRMSEPLVTEPIVSEPLSITSSVLTNLMVSSFTEHVRERLTAMMQPADGASNAGPELTSQPTPLLLDPRDRIGDASLGENSSDEDLDFEILDFKGEMNI